MAGRILKIAQDCLTCLERADLIEIEVNMLWPNDEQKRTEAEQTAIVAANLEITERLDTETLRELCHVAALATPLAEIHKRMRMTNRGEFIQGLIAGEILVLLRKRSVTNSPDASMKCVIVDVAKRFEPVWPIDSKTIENKVWPKYRPVAHFWAAYWCSVYERYGQQPELSYPFPCFTSDLELFLATAESFREWGEATKTRQAPSTVLRAHETVRLPVGLVLPKVKLDIVEAAA